MSLKTKKLTQEQEKMQYDYQKEFVWLIFLKHIPIQEPYQDNKKLRIPP